MWRSRSGLRATVAAVVVVLAALAISAAVESPAPSSGPARSAGPAPFRGLGTWVDVYDYGPRFQSSSVALPAVTPASVDDMARLGVKTIYLQAAQDDRRSEGDLVDRRLVGAFLRRAHQRGVQGVAWDLPHFP